LGEKQQRQLTSLVLRKDASDVFYFSLLDVDDKKKTGEMPEPEAKEPKERIYDRDAKKAVKHHRF
jgi:hypothetical protein